MIQSINRPRRPLALAVALAFALGRADAATVTVSSGLDDAGQLCTLRQAIATVANGANAGGDEGSCRSNATTDPDGFGTNDSIVFDNSAVAPGSTIVLTQGSALTLNGLATPLVIRGSAQTVDANDQSNVVSVFSSTLTVKNLNLTNGTSGVGAGLLANDSDVVLEDSSISGNAAATLGGGLRVVGGSTVTLTRASVTGNTSGTSGGGLSVASNSTVILVDSTVSGNSASDSGGIYASSSTIRLINSTIAGNSAAANAGIVGSDSTVELTQCTVSENSASGQFGGIHTFNGGSLTLRNTILSGNTASSIPNLYTYAVTRSITHSVLGTELMAALNSDGNQFDDAPVDALANNGGPTPTMAPSTGSAAFNNGDPALAKTVGDKPLNYDQRGPGFPRTLPDGTIDIGAYQHQENDRIFGYGFESIP